MYSKCKCCVPIVAKQQTANSDAFQTFVDEIKNNTNSIKLNHNNTVNITVEDPYIPLDIVYIMHRGSCKGLHRNIRTVKVVADIHKSVVNVIAKNRTNTIVAFIQTVEADGPTCTIDWYMRMVKHMRLGDSEFTGMLNIRCQMYYIQKVSKEVSKEVPITNEPQDQSLLSTQESKQCGDPDRGEYNTGQKVNCSPTTDTVKPPTEKRKPGYRRGPYKKRKTTVNTVINS